MHKTTPIAFVAALALGACSSEGTKSFTSSDMAVGGGAHADMSGSSYYAPAGYTLVSFLSATATTHSFAQADQVLAQGKDYLAVIETDVGRIVLDLYESQTPITVNSFVFLALHHYFDGIAFHRVIDGFMAQGGDPNSIDGDSSTWGTGDPGYKYGLEIVQALTYDGPGVLAMARTNDPNSNGSQFFITFVARHDLDGKYTIFGKVTEGMNVLPKIVRGEPPATPTRMTRVYIVAK